MDSAEDSSYLTLLNDGAHNFLLQTTEEALGVQDSSLNVEPMFAEIEDGSAAWSVGLPILMNGSLIPEGEQELQTGADLPMNGESVTATGDLNSALPELYREPLQTEKGMLGNPVENSQEINQVVYPIEIPGKGFITADGIFIADDLLLQLKLPNDEHLQQEVVEGTPAINPSLSESLEQEDMLINPKTLTPYCDNNTNNNNTVELVPQEITDSLITHFNPQIQNDGLNGNRNNSVADNGVHVQNVFVSDANNLHTGSLNLQDNVEGKMFEDLNTQKSRFVITSNRKPNTKRKHADSHNKGNSNSRSNLNKFKFNEMYEIVAAFKCKWCSFLCDKEEEIMLHWNTEHSPTHNKLQNNTPDSQLSEGHQTAGTNGKSVNYYASQAQKEPKSILKKIDHHTVFICSECNSGFPKMESLKNHMILAHELMRRPGEDKATIFGKVGMNGLKKGLNGNVGLNKSKYNNGANENGHQTKLASQIIPPKIQNSTNNETFEVETTTRNYISILSPSASTTNSRVTNKSTGEAQEEKNETLFHLDNSLAKMQPKETQAMPKLLNGELKPKVMKSMLKNSEHQTVFLCSECNLGFGNTEKLKSHMITAHNLVQRPEDNNKEADDKIKENNTKLTLALIKKQAKASKKIKCSVKGCDLRFATEEVRTRHEKCHVDGQKKQFKCFVCDAKFSIWRVCNMHMWKLHKIDLGLFTCEMCHTFKTTTSVRLYTHMAIHAEEKPFLCTECGKTFKQHSQLRNHQIIHKPAGTDNVPEWYLQQRCEICKKYFANTKTLKLHIKSVHDKFKPYICNICGHTTARKAMLELHLRQHTGEKPHKCSLCDYKTGDHNSLRRHSMRHSGDTKYSCPHCNYTSIQSTSYKKHIAAKHPGLGGSFFCTVCTYHTVNENTYINHMNHHKNGLIKDNCDNGVTGDSHLPSPLEAQNKADAIETDDETQNYLMMLDHSNDAIDTGGITIPAELDADAPIS